MYLDLLNETVIEHLDNQKKVKEQIVIKLTPFIYKTLLLELNNIAKFKTEVPIEFVEFNAIKLHGRSIKIESSNELDYIFEVKMVAKMLQLNALKGT